MFKPFNEHSNCRGHSNHLTSETYANPEDRAKLVKILDNYIQDEVDTI